VILNVRITLVVVYRSWLSKHVPFDVKLRFIEQIEKSKSHCSLFLSTRGSGFLLRNSSFL